MRAGNAQAAIVNGPAKLLFYRDCGGDVEKRFSKDDLCTTCTLYWITESYGTSARYYYEAAHNLWAPSHDRMPVVEAPTGAAVFLKEVMLMPRKWAERYYNLKRWTVMPSGGHFTRWKSPSCWSTNCAPSSALSGRELKSV
jgi:hypothetical protein